MTDEAIKKLFSPELAGPAPYYINIYMIEFDNNHNLYNNPLENYGYPKIKEINVEQGYILIEDLIRDRIVEEYRDLSTLQTVMYRTPKLMIDEDNPDFPYKTCYEGLWEFIDDKTRRAIYDEILRAAKVSGTNRRIKQMLDHVDTKGLRDAEDEEKRIPIPPASVLSDSTSASTEEHNN